MDAVKFADTEVGNPAVNKHSNKRSGGEVLQILLVNFVMDIHVLVKINNFFYLFFFYNIFLLSFFNFTVFGSIYFTF